MQNIGRYKQMTEFTTENAGTAEWCRASLDGVDYFVKKFQSPVYPSEDVELPEKKKKARILRFHNALENKKRLYECLNAQNSSGALLVPVEVMNYQYHICTIAEFVTGNVRPQDVCHLNPWQRLVLMRTLTKALMNVHAAGVVHSDMKPDNVVIEQSEEGNCRLRLIDFDGSFFMDDPPSKAEEVHGDPAFFSPEAYRLSMGEELALDHRIDIFALGMILHYFWCGRLPGKPADQTVGECVLRGGSITLDESLPLALRMTIMKMLDANPDNRLTCQDVDQVLGAQIMSGRYPPRPLVVIARPRPAPEGKKNVKDSTGGSKGSPAETGRGIKTITVLEVDTKGVTIGSRKVDVPYGAVREIPAKDLSGYRLISDRVHKVTVSKSGAADSPTVRFTYEKIGGGRKISPGVIVMLCILITALAIGIGVAISNTSRNSRVDRTHGNTITTNYGYNTVSVPAGSYRDFHYTPTVSGYYVIASKGTSSYARSDTKVEFCGFNGRDYVYIGGNDHQSNYGDNFRMGYNLEANVTYRFRVFNQASSGYDNSFQLYFNRE